MSCKYIIHACPERMWYVTGYLIPSMKEQGIEDITVRCDYQYIGNLDYCMEIFMRTPADGGAWHLQDDVIICHDFKERTEDLVVNNENKIICGFVYTKDKNCDKIGLVPMEEMWWSFPCVWIPNRYARECSRWYFKEARKMRKYEKYVNERKFDDLMFKEFMVLKYSEEEVLNVIPNLVDHVDFILGGSVINTQRVEKRTQSEYFEDTYLIDELARKIQINKE